MKKFVISTASYLMANAIGLLLAAFLLEDFRIGVSAFLIAVLIFSAAQGVVSPLLTRISEKRFPQIMGGISLVTIFLGLWVTSALVSDMETGGLANWLAATLLVWIGSLLAGLFLRLFVFRSSKSSSEEPG